MHDQSSVRFIELETLTGLWCLAYYLTTKKRIVKGKSSESPGAGQGYVDIPFILNICPVSV